MPDPVDMPDCDCGTPATHHRLRDDGTLGESLIDQAPCRGYRDPTAPAPAFNGEAPPNRFVMPGEDMAANAGFGAPAGASLADVLVNYDEVFRAIHGQYFQLLTQLTQTVGEYKAGFEQAVARMEAAEAERDALRAMLAE